MNAILIALLVALGLLIVISAYVSALCARGSRERYPLRVRDENEIGWMDARGDLYRELCARRRARVGRVLMFVAGVSLLALLILLTTRAAGDGVTLPAPDPAALPAAEELHALRVAKCRAVVDTLYPRSGFAPHCEFFIAEHERLGIGSEWQWSLAYGGANMELRCNYRARNGCAGPMDRPGGSTDPQANIRAHCKEAAYYRRTRGERGYALAKRVFYPRAPRDWGGGRIRKAYTRHVQIIEAAYRDGRLP